MSSTGRDTADEGLLARAASLLFAFTASDRELTGAELARRSGLPRSTAHRIVLELTELKLLERTPHGGFQLGMRLFELGALAPRQRGLRESAAPFLADLRDATHETVHLAVLDGVEVVYLDIIRPATAPKLRSRVGGRLPPSATAVGKAILAFSPPEVIDAVIAAGLPRITQYSITNGPRLRAELEQVRRTGTALDNQEQALGTTCCAAPIFGIGDKVIGAVSVSGHTSTLRTDRVAAAVRSTASGISRFQGASHTARRAQPAV